MLDIYDSELFDHLCNTVSESEALSDTDVANALQSLAHFEHLNYEAMGKLIKLSIEKCERFNM